MGYPRRAGRHRRLITVAAASSLACLALLGLRAALADPVLSGQLTWNLALAWIPVCAALALGTPVARRLPVAVALAAAWLVFLPNAPIS